jgi:hypothetical protein
MGGGIAPGYEFAVVPDETVAVGHGHGDFLNSFCCCEGSDSSCFYSDYEGRILNKGKELHFGVFHLLPVHVIIVQIEHKGYPGAVRHGATHQHKGNQSGDDGNAGRQAA